MKGMNEDNSMKLYIIINEQHTLLPDQQRLIDERTEEYDSIEEVKIPSCGLNLSEMYDLLDRLDPSKNMLLFVSPIPAMMSFIAQNGDPFLVFHNDRRNKKELPNGKIIYTVAKEGWVIV